MDRYATPILKVAFEGPDIPEESLYGLLRVRPFMTYTKSISSSSMTALWCNQQHNSAFAGSCRCTEGSDCELPSPTLRYHCAEYCTRRASPFVSQRTDNHNITHVLPEAHCSSRRPRLCDQPPKAVPSCTILPHWYCDLHGEHT